MDDIILTIDRLKDLLFIMEYEVIQDKSIPIFKPMDIYRHGNKVGTLKIEKKNLYFMNKNNKQVENLNLKRMKFDYKLQNNERELVHILIDDDYYKFDSYNVILDRGLDQKIKYVKLSNVDFSIKRYCYGVNIDIKALKEKIFVFDSGSSITLRNGKDIYNDVIIDEDDNYDYDRCESLMNDVYDYTGIDLIPNAIKLFDRNNNKRNKKYVYKK